MKLRVATTNSGKLREFREVLEPLGFTITGTDDVPNFSVVEDGTTFEANARKKVVALRQLIAGDVVADDSGLVVEALDGAPGLHSARYAGVDGPAKDQSNRTKLLDALRDVPDGRRGARFVCVLAYLAEGATEPLCFSGELAGTVSRAEKGQSGFGYDPIFFVPEHGKTVAELPAEVKNHISHRGRALAAFVDHLRRRTQ